MFDLPTFDKGTIWLTGAGPGDPGLLTLLAVKGLQEADIILYDALVNDSILDLAGSLCEKIFVGKRAGVRSAKQPEITEMMIRYARAGYRVLRLKGGDPFVFGRGGEEVMELAHAKVHFRVIPGITAGIGGLAYTGIPATHRDINTVVSFITGHDSTGQLPNDINWEGLAASSQVMVFYMATRTLPEIAEKLIHHGLKENTPLAIIENASMPSQKVFEATLDNYASALKEITPRTPALIVIGESVKIRGLIKDYQQTISQNLQNMGEGT